MLIKPKAKPIKNKIRVGSYTFDIFNIVLMMVFSVIIIYPFINIIAISLSSQSAIMAGKVTWLPVEFNTKGYEVVFGQSTIWRAYMNTVIYAVVGTIFNLVFTAMISYALMIPDFIAKKFLTIFLVITMFFNGGMVPNFLLIQNLNMMNTIWAIVIPGCVSAYNVFVYRAFFRGISTEIREAAYIDGAGDIQILTKIYVPLSKPLFATFGLFSVVGHWNRWFEPLLYIKDTSKQPIQMVLRTILFKSGAAGGSFDGAGEMLNNQIIHPKNIQYACIVATIGPILLVYPFIQKYFTKGMMIGAVKG